MAFNKNYIHTKNFSDNDGSERNTRTIYYGEVISIDDDTDGGRIKVRIADLDNRIGINELPWCYPLLPKFFHVYPQVGEVVRVFIENVKYPNKSRFWIGSLISQPQKIGFDSIYTAYSTTNIAMVEPEAAPSTYPDAKGVFPTKDDVALVGKVNTDVILRTNEVHLRAGKHENDDILKLNTKNPAQVSLVFEKDDEDNYHSNNVILADKIALISHDGIPKFKAANINRDDRIKIFNDSHPIARGDVLVEALNIMRTALVNHIHGYSGIPADKTALYELENMNFEAMLQKNIVIN